MKNLIWILIIICTPLINLSAQVTADFTADSTKSCKSMVVSFTNNSVPSSGLTYAWDFGNGNTSVIENPSVAYTQAGSYSVKLVVTDGVNSDTVIKTNYITIYSVPEVNTEISDVPSGCAPLSLHFNDLTTPGDGNIISWEWDFGDGIISNEQNPIHTYYFQSNYTVSLTVTDEYGCSDAGYLDSLISVYKPHADFMADYTFSCASQQDVDFYNNSYGDGNLLYLWNFGDLNTSDEENPSHTYNSNGIFDVSLVVTDEHSCKDTSYKEKYIDLSGVKANFSVNKDTLCSNDELVFTNTSENAYYFLWDFGDGTSSEQKNPTHIYSQPGTYEVILRATHAAGCYDYFSKSINIENITADFNLSQNYACQVPAVIHYNNLSENAVQYEWHFGNGELSNEENPTVLYSQSRIYNDTLIVYSPHGCRAEKIIDSSLIIKVPRAYFTPNLLADPWGVKGCAPLTVNFKENSFYNNSYDSIESYVWDFGDGTSSVEKEPVHVFNDVGKYLVRYYFITNKGCVSSDYYSQVMTGTVQQADFYKNLPDTVCASQAVQFFDDSQDSTLVDEWYWRFGDGDYSMKKDPVHLYTDTGYMDVKLQSYYNGCGAAKLKEKFIYIKGPIVKPDYSVNCDTPYDAMFFSNVIDAEKIYWDFGDGSPVDSVNLNPTHTYAENKFYTYNVRVENETNNCSYNVTDKVSIKDIKAYFEIDTTYGCENLEVNLNSKNSQDEYYFQKNTGYAMYYWDFGDNQIVHTNSPEIKHIYENKGTYRLKLITEDFRGCADSLIKQIKVYMPEPEFETNNVIGCMPKNVSFINLSQSDTTLVSWQWDFGDGTFSNLETPTHSYNQFGIYDVKLKIVDTLGCTNEILKPNYIEAIRPIPDFSTNDNTICFGDTVQFIPIDTSNVFSYHWEFGDGTFSDEQYPSHYYANAGYYPVTLSLVDNQGCDSTRNINNYIYMQNNPEPKFTAADTVSNCYPLFVNFSDTTDNTDIVDWNWDFGDGETSSHLKFPEHIYTLPGNYDVSLNVSTSNGCTGNIIKTGFIDIKGPYAEFNVPDTACKNSDITFIAENKKDVFGLQWIFGDGAVAETDTVIHAYNDMGLVRPVLLLKSDNFGTCDIYLNDSIYIPELVPEIISTDNLFSGCTPFEFNAYNNCNDADIWFWDSGDDTYSENSYLNHIYNTPGLYNVRLIISNTFGCTDTSDVSVEVYGLPNIYARDTLICRGDEIQLIANGAENYEWYPKTYLNEQDENAPLSKPDSSITYQVIGTDVNGCINSAEKTVRVQQEPYVNLKDTSIVIGEQVILDAYSKDIGIYEWFPNYNISCTDCPSAVVNPSEQTNYEVTVTDTAGCFTITYDANIDIEEKYSLDLPNAFTPDGDGINDVLYVRGWGIAELVSFEIFNRYGELVFQTNDINEGWNGNYKNKKQGIETFTYSVTVKTYDNQLISKRGTVKLLK